MLNVVRIFVELISLCYFVCGLREDTIGYAVCLFHHIFVQVCVVYEKSKQVLRAHSTGGAPCRERGVRYGHRNVALVATITRCLYAHVALRITLGCGVRACQVNSSVVVALSFLFPRQVGLLATVMRTLPITIR